MSLSTSNTSKIAIVTGGSRGLGRNTAIYLAKLGTGVILTYLENRSEAEATVVEIERHGPRGVALQLDTSDIKTFPAFTAVVKRALNDTWQRETFDQLVNNAGTYQPGAFADVTEAAFDQLYDVNLKGVFFLTQALVPLIADGGRIINISSGLTRISNPGSVAYASMKGALEVLTRYLAKELGARGIAVNTVAPGAIETDFGGGYIRDNEVANRRVASVTALGRAGVPDDIGPMIASLLSESNRWINAERIEVAGGMNL
jgi:NAD(P)-dependent dehydrogenase (short-subunit alcohol dehydrogenase family)